MDVANQHPWEALPRTFHPIHQALGNDYWNPTNSSMIPWIQSHGNSLKMRAIRRCRPTRATSDAYLGLEDVGVLKVQFFFAWLILQRRRIGLIVEDAKIMVYARFAKNGRTTSFQMPLRHESLVFLERIGWG